MQRQIPVLETFQAFEAVEGVEGVEAVMQAALMVIAQEQDRSELVHREVWPIQNTKKERSQPLVHQTSTCGQNVLCPIQIDLNLQHRTWRLQIGEGSLMQVAFLLQNKMRLRRCKVLELAHLWILICR